MARNVISGNGKSGITISGLGAANNFVEGNFIGTDATGMLAVPNVGNGIRVLNAASNRIGSAVDAEAGNLISGNGGSGIVFSQPGSAGGLVLGNFIGTTADGLSALGNAGHGVLMNAGATDIRVGGPTAIQRNVISGNGASGVTIATNSNGNRVVRNRIGTNLSGAPLGNAGSGVFIQSANNTIGGVTANSANIIAGNAHGITISGADATGNSIVFNTIGTNAASNAGRGIQLVSGASGNTMGPNNTIRRNESGIRVNGGSIDNRITENSIAENTNLGIDLFPGVGATPNDIADADGGGNLLQNTPAISGSPLLIGANLEIAFRVDSSTSNSAYPLTIEFYVSDGGGEGATFIGSTLYTAANFAAGIKSISFAGAGAGLTVGVTKIVGLATDLNGNTSEFSTQKTLASGGGSLSAVAQQNGENLDVNDDGVVSPLDALNLISFLSRNILADRNAERSNLAGSVNMYYDTNGDGLVTPLDALFVIQGLQRSQVKSHATPPMEEHDETEFWDEILLDVVLEATDPL
jgi:Dockerin type I domain